MKTKIEQFPAINPNPVLSVAKDGEVLYSNDAGETLLHRWGATVGEKLPPYLIDVVNGVISINAPQKIEVKTGNKTYLVTFYPLPEEECVNIYGFDISEQKDEIQSLRARLEEPEELQRAIREGDLDALVMPRSETDLLVFILDGADSAYHTLLETANEDMVIVDAEFKVTYAGKRLINKAGYSQEEVIGRSWLDFVDEEDKTAAKLHIEKRLQGINEIYELKFRCKNGSSFWALISAKSLIDKDGKFKGSVSMLTDITEHKQAEKALHMAYEQIKRQSEKYQLQNEELKAQSEELQETNEALRESEERFRTMANAIPQLAWIAHPDGCVYWYNERWYTYTGTTPEQMESWGWQSVHDPEVLPKVLEHWKASITTGQIFDMEFPLRGADGIFRPFLTRVLPLKDANGNILQWFGTSTDINERKRAEKAKEESEKRLSFALETIHTGTWDLDLVDHTAHRSLEHDHIFGYEQLLPQWTYEMFMDHVLPEDRTMVDSKFREATTSCNNWNFECRIRRVDGEVRWIWAAGRHSVDATGRVRRMAGIVQDITERKQAEEALRRSELRERERAEELETVLDSAPLPVIIVHDPEGSHMTGNRAADNLLRIPSSAEISLSAPEETKPLHFKAIKDGRELSIDELPAQRAARGIQVQDFEFNLVFNDGTKRDIVGYGTPLWDEKGKPRGAVHILVDITERKKAEEKIQILAKSVESSNDAIINKSLDGIITSWNKGAERIYGYSAEEILGKPISILEPPTLEGETDELAELIKQGDEIHNYETLRLRKDGTIINASIALSPVYDTSGQLTAMLVVARDITKNKKAEKELRKSEERYRIVTEQTGQIVYDYDLKTHKSNWAGAIEEVTGYNLEEFRRLNKNLMIENMFHPDINCIYENFQNVKNSKCRFKEELRLRRKDETYAFIENSGIYLMDHYGYPYRAVGVLKDITEIKEAEAKLKETLDNLEKLVKERTTELEEAYNSLLENELRLNEAQKIACLGNWDWNLLTDEIYWSDEIYRIFGLDSLELVPTYNEFLNHIDPEDRSYVYDATIKALNGDPYNIEYRITLPDGEKRIAHSQGEVVYDDKRTPVMMRGILQDITESKKAEEALEKIDKIRIKEIHHRIKNNLQVISSMLDL
jgi:PAS domain S-box-containing protein